MYEYNCLIFIILYLAFSSGNQWNYCTTIDPRFKSVYFQRRRWKSGYSQHHLNSSGGSWNQHFNTSHVWSQATDSAGKFTCISATNFHDPDATSKSMPCSIATWFR